MQTKMAGSCDQKRKWIRVKESEKNGGWKENERNTEKWRKKIHTGNPS